MSTEAVLSQGVKWRWIYLRMSNLSPVVGRYCTHGTIPWPAMKVACMQNATSLNVWLVIQVVERSSTGRLLQVATVMSADDFCFVVGGYRGAPSEVGHYRAVATSGRATFKYRVADDDFIRVYIQFLDAAVLPRTSYDCCRTCSVFSNYE